MKHASKKIFRCAIIGAGRIGAQFDSPKSKEILTHAHAYYNHKKTELVGFYDLDYLTAQKAAKQWGGIAYPTIRELFAEAKPDMVSVCVPDEHHAGILKEILAFNPKLVIAEKPVTTTVAETKKIMKLYDQKKIPVIVNYSRRFYSGIQKIKKDLDQKKYGAVLSASVMYTKGVLHNGSHAIDLARYFFGDVKTSRCLYSVNDFKSDDRTVGGFLTFEHCPQMYLMAGDARAYSIFEFDILCERGRIHLTHSSAMAEYYLVVPSPLYKGYSILGKPKLEKTGADKALTNLVDNAVQHLDNGEPIKCQVADALQAQTVCASLLK